MKKPKAKKTKQTTIQTYLETVAEKLESMISTNPEDFTKPLLSSLLKKVNTTAKKIKSAETRERKKSDRIQKAQALVEKRERLARLAREKLQGLETMSSKPKK